MSHDLSIQLPKTFFEGATLKFSPRALEEDGVLIKLEMPKAPEQESALADEEKGRFIHKFKIKHIKKRLVMGFFALLLVIKLIKIKLLYLLPLLLGVGTVKKLILKLLIFVFPAFASLFRYCSGHKQHHHHTVAYHHVPVETSIFDGWGPEYHRRNEFSSASANGEYFPESAPSGHYHNGPNAPYKGYYSYLTDEEQRFTRSPHPAVTEPTVFHYPNANARPPAKFNGYSKPSYSRPLQPPPQIQQPPTRYNQPVHNPPPRSIPPQQQVQHPVAAVQFNPAQPVHIATAGGNQKIYSPNVDETVVRSQITIQQQQTAIQQQQHAFQQQALLQQQALALQRQQQLQRQQALLLHQQRVQTLTPKPPQTTDLSSLLVYDSFYSPILQKMDNVFAQMGFNDEGCRERVVCSMYKSPARFSPHSNLISAELSRDPSELKKPTSSNSAVVRFYRYVQAAKDGQEGRDCIRQYPLCSVKTEK